ncbi:MAG: hypothetical protein ACREND_16005 [Gemmatimonadaceae bacterium]
MAGPQRTRPPFDAARIASSKAVIGFLAGLFSVVAAVCWHYRGVGTFIGAVIVEAIILGGVVRAGRRSTTP